MKKILVIDDDRDMGNLIKATLTYYGYKPLVAHSAKEGMAIAKEKIPDLILMDVIMPEMNGREACRHLKDDPLTKKIPVVFLTAKDSRDDIIGEAQSGGSGHLTKPFDIQELLEKIQELCG